MTVPLVPLVPVLVVVALVLLDVWVYRDATEQDRRGTPVVFWFGTLRIDTPAAWAASCLVLSVVFVPLYLAARNRDSVG